MTLLEDVINDASGSEVSVSTLLRKVKVLAARTGTAGNLGRWVDQELNGYAADDEIPAYRGPHATLVLGDFYGVMGSGVRNMQIPPVTFPEELRDGPLFNVIFVQSLAEIEDLARQEVVQIAWPPDGITYYNYAVGAGQIGRVVREDMILAQVVRPVSRSVLKGIIDAVRTRVLDLALSIESVAPNAGQPGADDATKREVQQVVNNYNFHGPNSNIAISSSNVSQTVGLPAAGDKAGLLRYLGASGISPSELVALEAALTEDEAAGVEGVEGPGVRAWLTRLAPAAGVELVATGTATLAIESLKAFFGG